MRHFNVRNRSSAFSLVETIVALLVVSIVLTGIFVLQNTIIIGDVSLSNRLNRVLGLKNIINEPAFLERDFKKEPFAQDVKQPAMRVTVSARAWQLRTQPKLKGLERIGLTGVWQSFGWPDDEDLVLLRFVPEPDKKGRP